MNETLNRKTVFNVKLLWLWRETDSNVKLLA
jgi:hypothetical protein